MEILEFKDKVFKRAVEEGLKEFEVFYSRDENLGITVYQGEIDKYSLSCTMGVGFRALINERMGYSYTEKLDDESVEFLVKAAVDSAKNIDSEEKEFINSIPEKYENIDTFNEYLEEVTTEEKIKLVMDLEREARASSGKVVNIGYCGLGCGAEERGIFNSHGIEASNRSNYIYAAVNPVVSDGNKKYNEFSYRMGNRFENLNPSELAVEAVREAESRIGGETVESGRYKVVLRNDVAAELLKTFSGAFCADNAQKGLSLLKGSEGSIIASERITLLDNPLMKDGMSSTPFDGEGTACCEKAVIHEGELKTLLHNLKTAAVDGVRTTGNASRPSYSSPIGVSPTNFYFQSGKFSLVELLKELGEGLLITDVAGTHSGANAITGDFSLAAKGFVITDGKLGKPVEQITIAGNYYQMLKDVIETGSDLKFILPSSSGYFGSPSLLVNELAVAGK
ncbi:MAG: TldD/PmbA family protein [Bacillota bacterium]|nr:TldD/PmbA family protein [Bacillota bacterium]